jgi:putative transposase
MAAAKFVVGKGRFPVRRVAAALRVSRSALVEAVKRPDPAPPRVQPKRQDEPLLGHIKGLVAERPSYGYRRVTALLRTRRPDAVVANHKRVYRVMKDHALLLQRHTGRPALTHEGKVMTLKSNLRWCSDAFEIRCFNGEKVFVTFALDSCDREVLAWTGSTAHPTSETIRDLMALNIEHRFGAGVTQVPHRLQWLSDNGPPYTAWETRSFGLNAGLVVVTTPAYSPESNGMSEAFVKTFKRDYVYLARLPDAATVLEQLGAWFEDYNEVHPHKALGMLSPRAFIRRRQAAA